jgi:hypothetical protein
MRRTLSVSAALVVAVTALRAPAQSRSPAARCRAACARAAERVHGRPPSCTACLLHPDEPAAWLEGLAAPPPGTLDDPEWSVRWGGLRLAARGTRTSAEQRLAGWAARSTGPERELACLTALQVAGARGLRLGELLSAARTGEPSAAPACAALEPRLVAALELALFASDPAERREAVRAVSRGLGASPAQVLLRAMATRPEHVDALLADDLMALAEDGDPPAGRALVSAAEPGNAAQVNRLLAVYGRRRDALRAELDAGSAVDRRAAARRLATLAPLSAPELSSCLADPDVAVRLIGARGLAAGEGRTLAEAAEARATSATGAGLEQALAWLELLAATSDRGCAGVALRAWGRAGAAARLRAAALSAAASCDWPRAEAAVMAAAASPALGERAAAAWAATRAPTTEATAALALACLRAEDPQLLAPGLAGAARHRLRAQVGRVAALARHPDAAVRAEALKALSVLDPGQARLKAPTSLARDADAGVRRAAAEALAALGGAQAIAALTRASRADPDAAVKFVAGESLRRLGAGSPLP